MTDTNEYHVTAKIDQVVTRTVEFIVEAESEDTAERIVREAINEEKSSPIARALVTKEDTYIPRSIEIVSNKKVYSKE